MSWDSLYEVVRSLWVVWLMLIFIGIVVWAFWPGRRTKKKMEHAARIPLEDEQGLPREGSSNASSKTES